MIQGLKFSPAGQISGIVDSDSAWWKERVYMGGREIDRRRQRWRKDQRTVQWERTNCLASPSLVK